MIQCQITFKKAFQEKHVPLKKQHALTKALGCSLEEISVIEQQEGNRVTFTMPSVAFDRLCALGHSHDPVLEELGVVRGKEMLKEPYNIGRIRFMLSKMFRDEELQTFCRKHFPAVFQERKPESKHSALLDALLEHASHTSKIPHILVLANQHNPELFQKYENSLYNHPRMFPSPKKTRPSSVSSNFRPVFFNLPLKDALSAFFSGTGIIAGLMFLLQKVIVFVTDAFLNYLFMGAILLLGMLVGETVLKATNSKRGQFLALLSVGCYWLGSILGNALAYFSDSGFELSMPAFANVMITGVAMTLSQWLPVFVGTILAYRTAR